MRGIVNALAVADEQHLGRLVCNAKLVFYLARNRPVSQQIEVVGLYAEYVVPVAFHTAQGHGTDRAGGTVFKNQDGLLGRFFFYFGELSIAREFIPVHL